MKNAYIDQGLGYVSQDRDIYKVTTENGSEVTINKVVPTNAGERLHHDFGQKWLYISALGLLLGGLLTVIFSLLAIWKNMNLLREGNLDQRESIHAKNLIITSVLLFGIGVMFSSLFIMHLVY
jgi:hypothetical protein